MINVYVRPCEINYPRILATHWPDITPAVASEVTTFPVTHETAFPHRDDQATNWAVVRLAHRHAVTQEHARVVAGISGLTGRAAQ